MRCIYDTIQCRKAGFYALSPQLLLLWSHGDHHVLASIIIREYTMHCLCFAL